MNNFYFSIKFTCFTKLTMAGFLLCFATCASANVEFSKQSCQKEINEMREIYISILRKIPAMPPLAQLSGGVQRALDQAERSRDSGDFKSCVIDMQRQISIVKPYS